MKNKIRATILVLTLATFATSPARTQQQPAAKDAKAKCACCGHPATDKADKKDATQHSGSEGCCQDMEERGAACCGKEAKTDSGKDAKAGCFKDGKMDCCKDEANYCAGKDAKMCQTKEGKGCCGEGGQCPAKAAAK